MRPDQLAKTRSSAYSSSRSVCVARSTGLAALRPAGAGPRSPQAAYGPTDEREEQGQDARDAQDSTQPLLRGCLLSALLRSLGQRNARELVYETNSQKTAHDRQQESDRKRQKRHQESVLETLTSSHPPCGVATNQEGQEQRDK